MKNLFYIAIIAMFFAACGEDDPIVYETELVGDVATENEFMLLDGSKKAFSFDGSSLEGVQPLSIPVGIVAAPKSSDVSYSFAVVDPTTAEEGNQLIVGSTSGTIPAGSLKAFLPLSVDLDAMEIGTEYTISVQLLSSDVTFKSAAVTYTVAKVCASTLGGTYDYVSTELVAAESATECPSDPVTGTVTFTDLGGGSYLVSDLGFGQYESTCWSDGPATSPNATFTDLCGVITSGGLDQYGLTYIWVITDVTGPNLSISWTNNYADSGNTVLTRTDGTDWPELSTQ